MVKYFAGAAFWGFLSIVDRMWGHLKNKTAKITIIAFFVIILIAVFGITALLTTPFSTEGREYPVFIQIPTGASSSTIAGILEDNGLVRNRTIFRLFVRFSGHGERLRAGKHILRKPLSVVDLAKRLSSEGGSFDIKVTVPECWTVYQIAEILNNTMVFDTTEFYSVVKDKKLLDSLGLDVPTMEGFLFPETYMIPENYTVKQVVLEMYGHFKSMWASKTDKARAYGRPMEEIITLASIIEAEATVGAERRKISSVYNNRLRINMLMQADPTTIYAIRKFDKPLTLDDLHTEHPYNTYYSPGLPPGPICNPSEACIDAAMDPIETDYLYFVARTDGTHMFSKTLQEHYDAIHLIRGK